MTPAKTTKTVQIITSTYRLTRRYWQMGKFVFYCREAKLPSSTRYSFVRQYFYH
ncbi:MAG: hypothetical protein ACI8WB_002565 [Phenylobacterium sp.]|jgi:hypothetical protein